MTEETKNADPARRERANASRPERVAHLRSQIVALLRIATTAAQNDQWVIADALFTEAISLRKEVHRIETGQPVREGIRGREEVHGEASPDAQVREMIHPFHEDCCFVGARGHMTPLFCAGCGTRYIPYG